MIKIPEWLARLPKNAMLDSKEFSEVLGISVSHLHSRLGGCRGMPKPDGKSRGRITADTGRQCCGKNRWKAVTVRNYIRYLNRVELEKNK